MVEMPSASRDQPQRSHVPDQVDGGRPRDDAAVESRSTLRIETELGQLPQQGLVHDPEFEPCQMGPEAVMHAGAESQVRELLAPRINLQRLGINAREIGIASCMGKGGQYV